MTEETPEIDPNIEAAAEQNGPDAEKIDCPSCGNMRRKFLIIDGKCDSCRTRNEAPGIVFSLGWPEVRHRRNILLDGSDRTQVLDRKDVIKTRFTSWRNSLRDVTKLSTPMDAWFELDRLEAERPSESD